MDKTKAEIDKETVIAWCRANGVKYKQPRPDQIMVDEWNFYPSTGSFNRNNERKVTETGAEAFLETVQRDRAARIEEAERRRDARSNNVSLREIIGRKSS